MSQMSLVLNSPLLLRLHHSTFFLSETKTISIERVYKRRMSNPSLNIKLDQNKGKKNQNTSKCLDIAILTLLFYISKSNQVE